MPSGFYAVAISGRIDWIYSIVFPNLPVPTPTPTPPASSTVAQIVTPAPGSNLASQTVTFRWTTVPTRRYLINVVTAPGLSYIYRSKKLKATSLAIGNFPTNGETVYIRLFSQVKQDKWRSRDYTYTSYSYDPRPVVVPAPSTGTTYLP